MLRSIEEQRMRRSKVCFVGYGSTEYSRNSEASALSYYADATRDALKRTGIDKKEIRGFSITTQASPDYSPHVAEQLGLEVDWVLNGDYGGAGGVMSVRRAADAIECGHLDLAVLVGGNSFDRSTPTQRQLEYQRGNFVDVFGYGGPNSLMALIQRLHMTNYGTTLEQIGKIAVAQRFNALNNPQALFRQPMTMQDYLNSRMISDPIRLFDCVMPCSGAECILLASEQRRSRSRTSWFISSPTRKFRITKSPICCPTRRPSGRKSLASGFFPKSNEKISTCLKSMMII